MPGGPQEAPHWPVRGSEGTVTPDWADRHGLSRRPRPDAVSMLDSWAANSELSLTLWLSPKSHVHWGHCLVCKSLRKHVRLQKVDS